MDLQEFTRLTLVQIVKGIELAQSETSATHGNEWERVRINPKVSERTEVYARHLCTEQGQPIHLVKFDVAVTTDRSSEAKAGAGIRIAGVGFGGDLKGTDRDTSVSRIVFEVPIVYPR